MTRMTRLPILFLLLAVVGFPQTARTGHGKSSPALRVKWPIRSIHIEGNHIYSREKLIAITGLKLGRPADKAAFDSARDRLLATGVLETVAYHFEPTANRDGYNVTFQVAEIQQIYPIRFEDIGQPREELLAWLKKKDPLFTGKISATDRILGAYSAYIEEYLKQKGVPKTIVAEMATDAPGELYVRFRPKGVLRIVAEVKFTGNKVVPTYVLAKAIHGVAVGSRYTETRFRDLLNVDIRPIYEARGRLRVAFPEIKTERATGDVNGVVVNVRIEEGESYNFGNISVVGADSLRQRLLEVANLKTGGIANMSEVVRAMERIRKEMGRLGYLKAECHGKRRIWDERKAVDIFLHVTPGEKFIFGKLIIEGLDINGEYEMRRIWGMKPGDVMNAAYPDAFLARVRAEGLFDNLKKTVSRIDLHEGAGTADVTLIFNPPERKMRFGTEPEPTGDKQRGRRR